MHIALIFFLSTKHAKILLSSPPDREIHLELHFSVASDKILYILSNFLFNVYPLLKINKEIVEWYLIYYIFTNLNYCSILYLKLTITFK